MLFLRRVDRSDDDQYWEWITQDPRLRAPRAVAELLHGPQAVTTREDIAVVAAHLRSCGFKLTDEDLPLAVVDGARSRVPWAWPRMPPDAGSSGLGGGERLIPCTRPFERASPGPSWRDR
jgi:hypothetical protein